MVEWKNIGDVCEIIRGNGVQKADFVESGVGCIHYGQIYTHYGPCTYTTNKFVSKEVFDKARKASKGDIIMTDTSENVEDICKSVAYLGEEDIAISNHALILKHNQNPKFLSYSTLTNSFLDQKRKFVVGVKVSGIKPEQLARIKIYLPSLSEQNRIVGILDTFTSSIENLKQQIAERRKQYEYYRDQLLDLEGKDGVEKTLLGEVGRLERGVRVVKKDLQEEGDIPVFQNSLTPLGYYERSNFPENTAFVICAGAAGEIGFSKKALWAADDCTCIVCSPLIISKYVYYFLKTKQHTLKSQVRKASVPRLSKDVIAKLHIPTPSLEEQSRIVSILDTFEASIANLEAQLKEREKQYEYYRNKLLTFE